MKGTSTLGKSSTSTESKQYKRSLQIRLKRSYLRLCILLSPLKFVRCNVICYIKAFTIENLSPLT